MSYFPPVDVAHSHTPMSQTVSTTKIRIDQNVVF
jgi:hypothetical protein